MDFTKVEMTTDEEMPARKGGGGGASTDYTPLFEQANKLDANGTDFVSFEGGSGLHNHRTAILQGVPEGCEVGDYVVRVVLVTPADSEAGVAEVNRMFIKPANKDEKANLIKREENRLARAAARANGETVADDDDADDADDSSPLD